MTAVRDLTCRELLDLLYELVADELGPEARRDAEAHLDICEACRFYLQNYQITLDLLARVGETPEAPVPDEVPDALIEALLATRRGARPEG